MSRDTFYISESGIDKEICGTQENPCMKFEQVWKQVERLGTLEKVKIIITDNYLLINSAQVIVSSEQQNFTVIHFSPLTNKSTHVDIMNSILSGIQIKVDNSRISLHLRSNRLVNAGLDVQGGEKQDVYPS